MIKHTDIDKVMPDSKCSMIAWPDSYGKLDDIVKNYSDMLAKIEGDDMHRVLNKIARAEYIPRELFELSMNDQFLKELSTGQTNLPLISCSIHEEACCICMCQFLEEKSLQTTPSKDNTEEPKSHKLKDHDASEHAIRLEHCTDHFFHMGCLHSMITAGSHTHIKCPVCQHIYGIKTGDQPDGHMAIDYDAGLHCKGYDGHGTIVIQYVFMDGMRNGVKYRGTRRVAYLPYTEEGKTVCLLLQVYIVCNLRRRLTGA